MKILLTGATGYIARRLLPVLIKNGHEVICCVRDKSRIASQNFPTDRVKIIEVNFLDKESLSNIPENIDAAYYLIHSMSSGGNDDFEKLETISANNFKERIQETKAKQVIYLGGIVNETKLSKHLKSRKNVESILASSTFSLTALRAGIIVGSGSASFEIIRDLVEKLPIMITPRWLETKSQPIAIKNVIEFLSGVLLNEKTYGNSYDIGGPEILTYKQMLLKFASVRKLKRKIFVVPVMTPKLSSYWLYFVTAVSYTLAKNLVNSMKVEITCSKNNLVSLLNIKLINYEDAIRNAFDKIEQQQVLSSWKDALTSHKLDEGLSQLIEIPTHGCFKDSREIGLTNEEQTLKKIWSIGGINGWYYANLLWSIRGFIDKIFGGVGLRRGRKNPVEISEGESLDFWRVLLADKKEKRLLLYAEMKLPGEAWLEFKIEDQKLFQTATFRPLGLLGRIYWYTLLPFHGFIFSGMIKRIAT
ncbi:MAG TPA: SDR family oxidoreductase [Ignavibacteriaceae bacterium]|nr:SDR family oxidoreductase [Ignavibacteriaceae bacterium]